MSTSKQSRYLIVASLLVVAILYAWISSWSITIQVDEDYYGWGYIVPVNTVYRDDRVQGDYLLNRYGVAYVDSSAYEGCIRIMKRDESITGALYFTNKISFSDRESGAYYTMLYFYIPRPEERIDTAVRRRLRKAAYSLEQQHRDSLIAAGNLELSRCATKAPSGRR